MSSSNYYMRPQDREGGGSNSVGRGYHHQSSSRSRGGRSRDRSLDIHDHDDQRDMRGEARRRRSGDGYHHHHSSSRYRSYDDEPRASGNRYQAPSRSRGRSRDHSVDFDARRNGRRNMSSDETRRRSSGYHQRSNNSSYYEPQRSQSCGPHSRYPSSSRDDHYCHQEHHRERNHSQFRKRWRSPDSSSQNVQLNDERVNRSRRQKGIGEGPQQQDTSYERRPLGPVNGAEMQMQRPAPHPMTSNGSERNDNAATLPLGRIMSSHQNHHPMDASHQHRPRQVQVRMPAPQFNKINDIPTLIQAAYSSLSAMSMNPSDTAAFWNSLAKQLGRNNHLNLAHEKMGSHINQLFEHTRRTLEMFGPMDLAQTTYSMAKLVDLLRNSRDSNGRRKDNIASSLSNLLLNDDATTINEDVFLPLANASARKLDQFDARHISNLAYAYALMRFVPVLPDGSDLFDHIAMQGIKMRAEFNAQEISNMVWAFATVKKRHDALFKALGDEVVAHEHLRDFRPQHLSNIVWAYATAGVNHQNLFEKVGNHIVRLNHLRDFYPQALSNIVWAYATAGVSHPKLFQQVAKTAIQCKEDFISQEVANILWSYATMGMVDKQLFSSFVPTAAKLIESCNHQNLTNIAWAYTVADVDSPALFNDHFINKCLEKKDGFSLEDLRQLHQWHLWQMKEKSRTGLPEALQDRCYNAFISRIPTPSTFQENVVSQLSSIGLDPREEILMESGYRIDAIVEVDGKTIGVEVDGPSHFIGKGKSPLAKTILKRRQVQSIDGIDLISVPYWKWDKPGNSQTKKQDYLRKLLNL